MKIADVLVHPNFIGLVIALAGVGLCFHNAAAGTAVITGATGIIGGAHLQKNSGVPDSPAPKS